MKVHYVNVGTGAWAVPSEDAKTACKIPIYTENLILGWHDEWSRITCRRCLSKRRSKPAAPKEGNR